MSLTDCAMTSQRRDWIVEDKERGLFSILAKIYSDPDIYRRERAGIFDKCWLYAAHESEVAAVGEFLTRNVGGRELLIVRGKDGRVRALLNACRHKAAPVCRERSGNATLFRCAYHAWTYNNHGMLVGVSSKDAYGADFATGIGLYEIRMENYRGLLFVCYDESAVDLRDYLAGATEILDLIFDKHQETALTIAPGSYRYNMSANWKVLMENSMDGYHLFSVHARYFNRYMPEVLGVKFNRADVFGSTAEYAGVRALGNGHCVSESKQITQNVDTHKVGAWEARFGHEKAKRMLEYNRVVLLYPNTIIAEQFLMIRTCFPLSPDVTESTAFALLPVGEDPTRREIRLQSFRTFQGPAGFGTPDDIEILEQCQKNFHAMADDGYVDSSRGMLRSVTQADDEEANRILLREWRRRLSSQAPM